MYGNKKILAIIPARGGSKGVPRKNIRALCGKPLIAWTIEEMKKSKYIDHSIVSTEDDEIKKVAESFGGNVPFMRPQELARDDTPGIEPVLHAIDKLPDYDYVILLQVTSPLRTVEDIDGAIELCINRQAKSCVSITETEHSPYWLYSLGDNDVMMPLLKISAAKMKDCDCVLNLAALIAIPYSYHSPDTYIATNVKGALNVVQAARELNIKKVVQTSTSEVYGTAQFVPISEKHPLHGQSPYAASKIGADQIAMSFFFSFDVPVAIIRPFNTYGPRQSARAVIPTIITQIANGNKKIKLGALSPTRDFNYVEDTVRGFSAVAFSEKSIGEVINIGSGFEVSIGDTAKYIAEVMNANIDIISDEERFRP